MSTAPLDSALGGSPTETPEITRYGMLSMQVCVPREMTDENVTKFANAENPAGTTHGWVIRKAGDEALRGDAERAQCEERPTCVHIMLDC